MQPRSKRTLLLVLAFAVSAGCLAWFIAMADWPQVWQALGSANYLWLIPAALAIWAPMVVRALRWRVLLLDVKRIGLVRLYNMQMIGIVATGVIPGRVGEFVKPILLARSERIPFFGTMGTVVVERILDLGLVVILAAVMLLVFPFPAGKTVEVYGFDQPQEVSAVLQAFGLSFALLCAVIFAFAAALVWRPQAAIGLVKATVGRFSVRFGEVVLSAMDRFRSGLLVFRSPRRALEAIGWTVLIWTGIMLSEYFLFFAFGIDAGLLGAGLLTAALALSVAVPQAPGFVGVFQLAATLVLVACFEVDESVAGAYAIVLWLVQLAFLVVLGFGSLAHEGLSFADMRGVQRDENDGSAAPPALPDAEA